MTHTIGACVKVFIDFGVDILSVVVAAHINDYREFAIGNLRENLLRALKTELSVHTETLLYVDWSIGWLFPQLCNDPDFGNAVGRNQS
jgi:hypothetical protein